MKEEWVHPNTITGDAATDGRYLRRGYINEEFWREVNKGNHILFVAPRRVGKTSIMKDLASNCPEGFVCVYEDIEGVKSRDGFYRRLFELILHCAHRSKFQEAKAFVKGCFEKYKISEITRSGIKIDRKDIEYEMEVRALIPQLKDAKVHAVIFLDEFAEVIHKFKGDRQQDAVDILHCLREIRHDDDFSHFTIVYTGSIGLESVIKRIDRPKLINDLHPIKLGALTDEEASRLIELITQGATIKISEHVSAHLKEKIEYLLPYYLQLMIEAIDDLAFKIDDPLVTDKLVDQAFQRILGERKNFEDWLERLKDYQRDHFAFINEILKHAAHKGNISIQEVYDKARKYGRTDDYMDFIDELVRDGYLTESEPHLYRFVAPFLKEFWKKNIQYMNNQGYPDNFYYYQNANANAETVKAGFLVRQYEFNVILDDLCRHPDGGAVQHYLILGRRGSGKSTLLRRIQVEIDTNSKLSSYYIALNLAEEQANIYRFFDLLEEIVRELETQGYNISWPASGEVDDYANALLSVIHEALQSVDKKLVLLLDNIDRVFENLGEDSAVLRAYLQNYGDIKIIGGSTRMTEHFWSYDQPFYEFFRVLQLRPLDRKEIRDLLLSWGDQLDTPLLKEFIENRPGQLETVRILTDGLPRTLQFFVDILLSQEPQAGYDYVRQIMDKVTPLYQERLNHLPPAQRKIVLQLAFFWESVGTGDLSKVTRMENRVVSAQLNQLVDKGVIDKIVTSTKNHLYRLSERFFNLWLIFTQGSPREKRRAKYLTIFLENFYDAEGLNRSAQLHLKSLNGNSISPDKAALLTKAYSQSSYISTSLRDRLIEATRILPGIMDALRNELPSTIAEILGKVREHTVKMEWERAAEVISTIEQEDGYREMLYGVLFILKNDNDRSIKVLLESYQKGYVPVAIILGKAYQNMGKLDDAVNYAEIAFQHKQSGSGRLLATLYCQQNKNRTVAMSIWKESFGEFENSNLTGDDRSMYPVIKAWTGNFEGLEADLYALVVAKNPLLEYTLRQLLVHHQRLLVLQLFQDEDLGSQLSEEFFFIHMAAASLMDYGAAIANKIPPELQGTVDDYLLDVYRDRDFYYATNEAEEYLKVLLARG